MYAVLSLSGLSLAGSPEEYQNRHTVYNPFVGTVRMTDRAEARSLKSAFFSAFLIFNFISTRSIFRVGKTWTPSTAATLGRRQISDPRLEVGLSLSPEVITLLWGLYGAHFDSQFLKVSVCHRGEAGREWLSWWREHGTVLCTWCGLGNRGQGVFLRGVKRVLEGARIH